MPGKTRRISMQTSATNDRTPLPPDVELLARYDRPVPRYTSYPAATHFSAEVGADDYAAWLGSLPQQERLSLYLHVPFCAELCLYCGCHTTVVRRYEPVAAYADMLLREIALVAERLGEGRPVAHIHWGGGTPTMLSPRHLLDITEALRRRFTICGDAEIAVEIDPRTLDLGHVGALTAMGVTRASLGVQDFNSEVQSAIGRFQSYDQTARAADWLRRAGIRSLNLDLMYGLPLQTVSSVVGSVRTALRLQPDRIALFGYAHVPWMKRHQALLPAESLPDAHARLGQMRAAAAAIVEAGYVAIGLDHFARPRDELARALRDGRLHRNFQGYTTDRAPSLIGFGASSIGALPQGYVQNAASTVKWRDAIAAGQLATTRGLMLTADDRLRRDIIERLMCDLAVDLDHVAGAHGSSPEDFAPELASLNSIAGDGLVERDGYRITVSEAARPFLRSVCAAFDRHLTPEPMRHSHAI